eukprot:snap_masked-scaffold_10-processed-gene-3.24-mRNA-1 protein AED:1.00 eAED:1.00 QI:0/-1/0/0/-1/1/1/0/77
MEKILLSFQCKEKYHLVKLSINRVSIYLRPKEKVLNFWIGTERITSYKSILLNKDSKQFVDLGEKVKVGYEIVYIGN